MLDKSWEPGMFWNSHSISFYMLNNFCFHGYVQKSLSHSLTLSLSRSLILSFTLSRHAEQLLFSCLGSKVTLSLSHSRTLALFQSLIQSLLTCWTTFVLISMLKTHPHTFSLSLSLAISLSLFLTLTVSHSLIHSLSTCWTTFVFMFMLKSHCLVFIAENCNAFFWTAATTTTTPSRYFRSHRAGYQLKNIHPCW